MTIAEVAKKYDLTADTLRYYERVGLIPHVGRSGGGIREYGEVDCNWIEFIKCMRSAGIPIEVLIEYVSLFGKGDLTRGARKEILIEQRNVVINKIAELSKVLERLSNKIEHYDDDFSKKEESLFRAE